VSKRQYILYGLAAWAVLLVYFWRLDREAFILSLALTPPLSALLLISVRSGHLVLSFFIGFALISHAVAPPFFFINRVNYSYGGSFGAVKDFRFGMGEFFGIYSYVLIFLAATVVFAVLSNALLGGRQVVMRRRTAVRSPLKHLSRATRVRNAWLLTLFIVLVGIPLSLAMYWMRIGMTGVEAPVLPYRLTGLTTYFRMFGIPLVIFSLYSASTRNRFLTALIIFYTALGGLASASRYFIFAVVAPAALYSLVDRKVMRFCLVAASTGVIFILVTASRDYVYLGAMPFLELLRTTINGYDPSTFSGFQLVGGIANRLWGPQDIVLAYQYAVANQPAAIVKYFTIQVVVPDLTYELYGMTFSGANAAFGVGIGYIPWMILLANRSISVLLGLALVTACFLTASERLVDVFRRRGGNFFTAGGQALAFVLVYLLYASVLNWWYQAVLLACVPAALLQLKRGRRRRKAAGTSTVDYPQDDPLAAATKP
jgi:hypothetical protein